MEKDTDEILTAEAEDEDEVVAFSAPKKKVCRNMTEDTPEGKGTADGYLKYPSSDRRQLAFDMIITRYIVTSSLPFTHVDTESFRTMMATLQPRATVKSASALTRSKLPSIFHLMRKELDNVLRKELANTPGVAFFADYWTSQAGDQCLSLTLHYVCKEWKMRRFSLNRQTFEGIPTAARVAQALDEQLTSIPCRKGTNMVVVHEAGANMTRVFDNSTAAVTSFKCINRGLLTVLSEAFADPEAMLVDIVLKKAANLAALMHISPQAYRMIEAECKNLGIQYVKVTNPVPTSWNSRSMMAQSIIIIAPALSSLMEKNIHIGAPFFTESELKLLKLVQIVLGKFNEATWRLSAEKETPTMCHVITALLKLKEWMELFIKRGQYYKTFYGRIL